MKLLTRRWYFHQQNPLPNKTMGHPTFGRTSRSQFDVVFTQVGKFITILLSSLCLLLSIFSFDIIIHHTNLFVAFPLFVLCFISLFLNLHHSSSAHIWLLRTIYFIIFVLTNSVTFGLVIFKFFCVLTIHKLLDVFFIFILMLINNRMSNN